MLKKPTAAQKDQRVVEKRMKAEEARRDIYGHNCMRIEEPVVSYHLLNSKESTPH